jgi:3-dehydroquinate synthetase
MHGECVAIGCVAEAELALLVGYDTLTREKIDRSPPIRRPYTTRGYPWP